VQLQVIRLNAKQSKVTILLVGDSDSWRAKVCEMVNHSGDIVGEACDGLEAVEKATQLKPDIVILDLSMPRMNGIEAARLIRQRVRSTGIVFLSQNTDADIKQKSKPYGRSQPP